MIDWGRIDRIDPALGAFTDLDRSAVNGEGPLSSLAIGIKANIAVRGLPHTGGMALRRDIIADRDAEVVARLRSAGAAIVGSLNMHEAALGATTDNRWFGRTHNPHRSGFTPGGSSGGSGAAVAAGLVDAALGTDTLGSIRIPASYCGVYGLKPTHGAVPSDGLVFLARDYDSIGPLARSLDVLEQVWRAIGPPPPAAAPPFARLVVLDKLARVEVQPAVRSAYDRALAAIDLPRRTFALEDDPTAIRLAALAEVARALIADLGTDRTQRADLISPELTFILGALEAMPLQPEVLARTRSSLSAALGEDGVLLLPAAPQVAFAHGGSAPHNQADFTGLANIVGLPAIAIPAGTDPDGLPIGLQLVGPPHSEDCLIALARHLEPALGGAIPLPQEPHP